MGIAHPGPAEMYDSAQLGSGSEKSARGQVVELLPFFNESDILEARLAITDGYVARTVVCEGDRTHQGAPKAPVLDITPPFNRIWHYIGALPTGTGEAANWARERAQRDYLHHGLRDLDPDDLVLSCDLDEIVMPDALDRIREACKHGPVSLGMRMIYYGHRENPAPWIAAKAFRAKHAPRSLTDLRFGGSPVVPDCGWHLSYLGDVNRRRAKVEAFLHAENRPGTVAWDRIAEGQDGPNGESLIDFDPNELPATLRELVLGAS